jgi:hypothetical protein
VKTVKTLLLSLILMATAAACGQDVAGHYVSHVMEVGSELLLKPNGQFEFMLAYGAADYWAKGTWRRDGNAVVLTSSGKEEPPFRFLRSEAGKPGQIRVWVLLANSGKGVPNIDVKLLAEGEPLAATTGEDGSAVFPDAPKAHAVTFEVSVYDLVTKPFAIDPEDKDFYYEINGEALTQVLFKDERLPIDGNALVMTHWGAKHPIRYEKEE